MRKIVFSAAFILILFCAVETLADVSADGYGEAASQGAEETVKGDVQDTLDNARDAYDEMGKVTYEKSIPKPEDVQDAASSCLDGILSADFGFGLSVPSVSSILNSACRSINSGVTGYLNSVEGELSNEYSRIDAGLGNNSAPSRVNYEQVGGGIADDLWNEMTGDDKR